MTDISSINCTAVDLASITGITEQRIHQLVKKGILNKTERGVFNLAESVGSYCAYIRSVSRGSESKKEENTHRNRLLEAKADMAAMEAARIRGDLISASVAHSQSFTLATILKNNLFSIPDRIAAIIAAESDTNTVYDLLNKEIHISLDNVIKSMESTEVDDASLDITRRNANEALSKNVPATEEHEHDPTHPLFID